MALAAGGGVGTHPQASDQVDGVQAFLLLCCLRSSKHTSFQNPKPHLTLHSSHSRSAGLLSAPWPQAVLALPLGKPHPGRKDVCHTHELVEREQGVCQVTDSALQDGEP